MKNTIVSTIFACFLLGGSTPLHSQAPQEGKSPLAVLQAVKAANQELIEKQKKTLVALDDLLTNASQLKIMGKRN